eukprot:COSAG06_NODE_11125_length_1563_cov_4.163934_1_plen_362_part_00
MLRATLGLAAAAAAAAAAAPPSTLAPAGFDCKTRHLAMEYARKIQPFRSKADFDYLAEVLDMHGGTPGGPAQCFNVTYDGPDQTFTPTFPISPTGTVVYADSVNGKDSNAGTMEAPFATIGAALAATRKKGGSGGGGDGATVVLRKGVYYGEEALNLTVADSGLTIQNYNGEEAWLSGAKPLKVKWTAGGRDHPRFGEAGFAAKSVWKTDLSGQGVKVIEGLRIAQARAVRARYPNGCTPCSGDSCKPLPSNYLCQGFQNGSKVVDPNDGFGSNLVLSDDSTGSQGWIKPTRAQMRTLLLSIYTESHALGSCLITLLTAARVLVPAAPTMHQKEWTEFNPPEPLRKTGESFQTFQLGIGGR